MRCAKIHALSLHPGKVDLKNRSSFFYRSMRTMGMLQPFLKVFVEGAVTTEDGNLTILKPHLYSGFTDAQSLGYLLADERRQAD